MRARILAFLAFALVALAASRAHALASEYTKEQLALEGQFVKGQIPVYGYWVNWTDTFFYEGGAAKFNEFAEAYGKFKHVQLKVVLHKGTLKAVAPWKTAAGPVPADWSLYVWRTGLSLTETPLDHAGKPLALDPDAKLAPTQIDVWAGERLKLADLRIPAHIEVAAADREPADREIAEFIARRPKKAQ